MGTRVYIARRMSGERLEDVVVQTDDEDATKAKVRALYNNLDKDNNGVLDKQEFASMMTTEYGFTKQESDEVFDKWDMDKNGGMDFDEFFEIVRHIEMAKQEVAMKIVGSAVGNTEDEAVGTMASLMLWLYFGAICCLCTLCLSWLPYYCKAKSIGDAAIKAQQEAKTPYETAKDVLKNGPA